MSSSNVLLGPGALIVFLAFWSLLALALWRKPGIASVSERGAGEWALDAAGLLMQGLVVPVLQGTALVLALEAAFPAWRGALRLPGWAAFMLNFALVDYAFYWNHRLLHGPLWGWHAAHHTARELDVLVTSRNALWSPFLIVYVWVNAAGAFLLADPGPFLFSASVTAALDLWRHSRLWPEHGAGGLPLRWLQGVLVTPLDHAWHHSEDRTEVNFGANLKIWDALHGTLHAPGRFPERLGITVAETPLRMLLAPVGVAAGDGLPGVEPRPHAARARRGSEVCA